MFRTLASLSLLTAMAAIGAACFSLDEERCYECKEGNGPGPGSGGGGGEIPTDPSCVPSAAQTPVGDDCGVFVSAKGDNTASGTKAEPVKTIAKAIELAGKGTGRVYACAEELAGAVTLPGGVELYGGLDCGAGWAYAGESKPTRITAPAGQIALTLTKGSGTTRIEDVLVTAANASAAGGSSIAALVDGATVELTRCTLEAGTGADGASGDAFTEPAAAGVDGNAGSEACSAGVVLGGNEVANECGDEDSIGGNGGQGNLNSGGSGTEGSPGATLNGGVGEKTGAMCGNGNPGEPGADGAPGSGGVMLGKVDSAGYAGQVGADGGAGKAGQGGGGGGGAKGGSGLNKCSDGAMAGGASGGSGASGGCGGLGGKGGGAGGASIALVSLNAEVTFKESTLIAKNGGSGGVGGLGQEGGPGGANGGAGGGVPAAAALLQAACAGGPGGAGGRGGPGGNGAGGHSLGIAFTGAAPSTMGAMIQKGTGGTGGTPVDPAGQAGSPGVSADAQEFAAP